MSGYVRETKYSGAFEGKPVTATLAPLTFKDALRLEGTEVKDDAEVAALLADILPAYVKTFEGVSDADGNPMTIAEVCGSAYFGTLIVDIGWHLIKAAKPSNPAKPSVQSAS